MKLEERITRLLDGLVRAEAVWREEGTREGGSSISLVYADVIKEEIPHLRDILGESQTAKRGAIETLVQILRDKAVFVAHGRAMDDMEMTERAEYVQLKRLAEQVANLLNALPTRG